MQQDNFRISYTFRGKLFSATFEGKEATVGQLGRNIQSQTGTSYDTLKILGGGLKGALQIAPNEGKTCSESGLLNGKQYMVLGSSQSDIQRIREAKELPGLLGFDGEVKRAAMRRRTRANTKANPPRGEFTFGDYKVLNLPTAMPASSEALKMLHRLAADPGIVGIMNERKWKVGLLSEMPPEGRVGVSEVCVLGYNVNKGQEIALRLRTDDLKGLRKYRSIRDTLVHELTHMVWSDHDINFKMLNSELSKDCERFNTQSVSGSVLGGDFLGRQSSDEMDIDEEQQSHSDGQKLGGKSVAPGPSLAAGEAALRRMMGSLPGKETVVAVSQEGRQPSSDQGEMMVAPIQVETEGGGSDVLVHQSRRPEVGMSSSMVGDSGESQASDPEEPVVADVLLSLSDSSTANSAGQEAEASVPSITQQSNRSPDSDASFPGVFSENDPAVERARKAESAVQQLWVDAPSNALTALHTLEKVFQNALDFPAVEKYRSLRMGNPGFLNRVGRHRHAVELMKLVGFVEEGDPLDAILRLKRQDPGLLWLGLSVVKQGIQKFS
ncbi:hypothetical protein BSKO_13985 [Bryopsis sp. KO-2023]|nr:hypothetical protein BSKO_13985 [Bryopsis sp. KO-2023]